MLKTPICEQLGIEYPIILAGMGGVSMANLVAAVSEAGGLGMMGAASLDPRGLRKEIEAVKNQTDKPFSVDLLMALPTYLKKALDIIFEMEVPVFTTGLGVPPDVIKRCKDNGVKVISMIGKVAHATAAHEAGVDIIVAQGTEAGGHTGQVGTFALVPQVVDAVPEPVLVAGGVGDGRHLVAALAMGAQGVVVGTRFIASEEANATDVYRQAIIDASESDTLITRCYTGKTLRAISNDYTAGWEKKKDKLQKFPMQAMVSSQDGTMGFMTNTVSDPSKDAMPAGQVSGMIHEVKPAAEILQDMVHEAEAILDDGFGLVH